MPSQRQRERRPSDEVIGRRSDKRRYGDRRLGQRSPGTSPEVDSLAVSPTLLVRDE